MTRTTLLKVKVGGAFKEVRLGDILKEFAAQVEMSLSMHCMWRYATGFPFAKKVSFTAKDLPLETALDELLKQAKTMPVIVLYFVQFVLCSPRRSPSRR